MYFIFEYILSLNDYINTLLQNSSFLLRILVYLNLHWENRFFESEKHFFDIRSKNVLLIQKNFLWSREIDLFTLKKMFLDQQNFLQFKDIFFLTVYQINVSLIQRNYFLGVLKEKKLATWFTSIYVFRF